ncbi:hypothetical protein [Mitsuaria sp. GD03876]|uniref:DUF7684 family protein n=1 Tax=Mitsuaria sp. GD03876 TaxID=2975399 RepID=UPI002449146C|nr:hypothetical protein [Mitsuaria sp. GD03876]MDH0867548.1 hypothetical protein [Mitsuaria sp. GD03876]
MTSRLFRIERSSLGKIVYLWLSPDVEFPRLPFGTPFRALVVSELHPEAARQSAICEWLAASGCRYLMAWGQEASSWDDSMDWAALERSGYVVDADGEDFIPTTWHDGESLAEVLHFASNHAKHPTLELEDLLVLRLAHSPDPEDVLGQGPR